MAADASGWRVIAMAPNGVVVCLGFSVGGRPLSEARQVAGTLLLRRACARFGQVVSVSRGYGEDPTDGGTEPCAVAVVVRDGLDVAGLLAHVRRLGRELGQVEVGLVVGHASCETTCGKGGV